VVVLEFEPLSIHKDAIVGQRSIILKNACVGNEAHVYPLSAIPPKEAITSGESRDGLLADSYFLRSHEEALDSSAHRLSSSQPLRKKLFKKSPALEQSLHKILDISASSRSLPKPICDDDIDMVVIGAGVSGIVAAHKFQKKNIIVRVLEKSSKIMGCWQTFANSTSHVAVTEATYRLSGVTEDRHAADYNPSRALVLAHGSWLILMR